MTKNILIVGLAAILVVVLLPFSGSPVRHLQSEVRALWLRIEPPTTLIETFPPSVTLAKGESAATKDGKFLIKRSRNGDSYSVTTPLGTTRDIPIEWRASSSHESMQVGKESIFDGMYSVKIGYDYGDKVVFDISDLSAGLSIEGSGDGIQMITPNKNDMIPLSGTITLELNSSGSCNQRHYLLDMIGTEKGAGQPIVVPSGTCKPTIQDVPFQYNRTGEYYIYLTEQISPTLERKVAHRNVVVVGSSVDNCEQVRLASVNKIMCNNEEKTVFEFETFSVLGENVW